VDPDWLAIYVFYTGNPRPMLTTCVRPLLQSLLADGLISRYFFLNYWLEGPHIRVRVLPADADKRDEVKARMEAAITAFLTKRPSLYEVKSDFYVGLYNTLFGLEFDDEQRAQYLGEDGQMRLRPNNSFHWADYEPEYDKYGGLPGVRLAEWHFMRSTDMVLDSMSVMNLHMRTVLLGFAAQLMMVMTSVFLPDDDAIVEFLERYRDFWHASFADTDLISGRDFERSQETMAAAVSHRYQVISTAVRSGEGSQLPGAVGQWATHCAELRAKVVEHAEAGKLTFRAWEGTHRTAVTDPAEALVRVLSAYLHMTNNRLHVTITDEAYLADILVRAVRAPAGRSVCEEAG
jgi:thiopeptide-type bacteriocin biosynthesis protein